MNQKIILLFVISSLYESNVQAALTQDLQELRIALSDLQNELEKPPVPSREYKAEYEVEKVPEFPLPLPKRELPPPKKPLTRTTSTYFPKTPLSQLTETVTPQRPAPQVQPLFQTTPPGGLSLAERRKSLKLKEKIEKEKEKEETPKQIRKPRPQSAIFSRPPLEQEVPKKTVNWVNLKNSIQQLESLPSTGPEQTTRKKLEAKATLDAINRLVEKTPLGDLRRRRPQLWEAIKPILDTDPLLIQSAIITLRKCYLNASEANAELYQLMSDLYENRIAFLENEFKKIKPGYKLAKGIRDDIDEGLAYPIEISGEVQDAEIKANLSQDAQATDFYNNINDQWLRLLMLLKGLSREQKQALLEEGIDIDEYLNSIEENKLRAYCAYDPKLRTQECRPYRSFYDELAEMAQTAENFRNNQERYINNRTRKTFAIQNIINKLKAFAAYAQNPKICQICLNEDAQKANEESTRRNFQEIINFFKNRLSEDPENKKYLEVLQTIESIKAEEAKRRENVRKYGVGYGIK